MKLPAIKWLSVKRFAGFHADIPLRDGATSVPILPFPYPYAASLVVSGFVLAIDEKSPRVVGGIDAYTSALRHANGTNITISVPTILIPTTSLNADFWEKWPAREIASANYDIEDRISLLKRLCQVQHSSVKGSSIQELTTRFSCSGRTVKRARQETGTSRPYNRHNAVTTIEESAT